ncbi:MAG: ABC transporter ATP-binding protein [Candidatus Lokiarchaeota archaeon]|nr:ABC transporter ATP-binding protein [Candidatus Lokiarchaeota archaeon]
MGSGRMIFKYWFKSRNKFLYSAGYQILSTIFALFTPIFIGRMVGGLDQNNSIPSTSIDLLINFIFILIFAFFSFLTNRAGRIQGAVVASAAAYHLRADISNAIYRQSFSYFDKTETGQLVARATSDVEETQGIFGMGFNLGLQGTIQLVGVMVASIFLNFQLALIFVTIIPISLIASFLLTKKMKPIYFETRESFGELTNTIRENIIGAQVVRMFSNQDKERQKFYNNNKRFYNASVRTAKLNSLYMPMNYVIIGFTMIFTLFLGGNLVIQGEMQLGTLVTFQGYIGIMMFPLVMWGQIMMMYIQANAALTRIREVIESTPDVKDTPGAISIESMKGDVKFENVTFGYTSEHRVLKNITFEIPAGKKLAIIGTTGSGKSTIINLLPRFYEINEGMIQIDDINIKNYLLKDLRKNIGIVSQETFLFNRSIAKNIAFGAENATQEEIESAAKTANLHDFIMSLPEKYDSIVGERGTRLSGGQKQRLSIARALIVKPKILIFDDSTSSVDVETEFKIQNALEKIMKGTTTLIITQRISTIRNANLILVLDKGRVVGLGTHEQLIELNVLYKQIYETLFQKQKSGTIIKTETVKGGI